MRQISDELYERLEYLGIIDETGVRGRNFGASDYNEHTITVWSIWLDYPNLSVFEKMMIKYLLREKDTDPKEMDLKKVIHYAEERLRQLSLEKKAKEVDGRVCGDCRCCIECGSPDWSECECSKFGFRVRKTDGCCKDIENYQ